MYRQDSMNRTFKFSHRAIEGLEPPPPEHPSSNIEYTDSAESGLRIAVYKSGKRSFRHRYTYLGKKQMMTLGEFPAVNVEKARERVRANKAMLAEDIDPKEERQQKREAPTFAQFVEEEYLPYAEEELSSIKDIRSRLKCHLLPTFGEKQLFRITKVDVTRFHQEIKEKLSPASANRCLSDVSSIFRRAIELGVATENPCRGISKAKEGGGRKRVLSGDELGRFVKALRESMNTPSGRVLYLLLATGLRKSEVASWQWSNVDFENRRVFLPKTKSGIPRYVPLNSQAVDLLKLMQENRSRNIDWVFPSHSKSGHLEEMRKTFRSILKKAQLSNLRIHDLRRSFASLLINQGVPIYDVRDLLGHADIRTTQIYAHLATSTLQNSSEKAASALEKAFSMAQ